MLLLSLLFLVEVVLCLDSVCVCVGGGRGRPLPLVQAGKQSSERGKTKRVKHHYNNNQSLSLHGALLGPGLMERDESLRVIIVYIPILCVCVCCVVYAHEI